MADLLREAGLSRYGSCILPVSDSQYQLSRLVRSGHYQQPGRNTGLLPVSGFLLILRGSKSLYFHVSLCYNLSKSEEECKMQKIVWVRSSANAKSVDDGLDEVNRYLEQGWSVKLISACATNNMNFGQAYIVLEKE